MPAWVRWHPEGEESMTIHELKTVYPYFSQVWYGDKNFEIRKNDRNFKKGDRLILREYDKEKESKPYSGRCIFCKIDCILISENTFIGLSEDYLVMKITVIDKWEEP